MAATPHPLGPPPPLESHHSLVLFNSEQVLTTGHTEILQALQNVHNSLLERLEILGRDVRGGPQRAPPDEMPQMAPRSGTTQSKKNKAKDSIAMQALRLDISNLLPGNVEESGSWSLDFAREHFKRPKRKDHQAQGTAEAENEEALPVLPQVHQEKVVARKRNGRKKRSSTTPEELGRSQLGADDDSTSGEVPRLRERRCSLGQQRGQSSSEAIEQRASGSSMVRADSIKHKHSGGLQEAVSRANLTEVFKVREMELTEALSPKAATTNPTETGQDGAIEVQAENRLTSSSSCWQRLGFLEVLAAQHLSKALGLVPIFETCHPCSFGHCTSRLYHWLMLSYLLYGSVSVGLELGDCTAEQNDACKRLWPPLAVDLFLHVGACLVLMSFGGVWNYTDTTKLVAQSAKELHVICEQQSLDEVWRGWSASDALRALLLWLVLLLGRIGFSGWPVEQPPIDVNTWPHWIGHAVSTGIVAVACFWQVRTSHAMLLIVNSWSASVLEGNMTHMERKNTWRCVSGLFRKTSRTFERCFAALGFIVVLLVFASIYDLRNGHLRELFTPIAVVLIVAGVLWTLASTTTACNRLPSLVSLLESDSYEEDLEHMDLAMFLSLSECGFFVWDTCVTVGAIQKFLYFTAAVAGTVGFQSGALNLQS